MRKIAIIGTAPSAVHAPWKDDTWERWVVGYGHTENIDRVIEPHRMAAETPDRGKGLTEECRKWHESGAEIWGLFPIEGVDVKPIPSREIAERWGTFFIKSSFSWAMFMAILELRPEPGRGENNGDEIALFGVDMEFGTEYRYQLIGLRHCMAMAKELGVKISRLADSGIAFEPIPYPMWQDDPINAKARLKQEKTAEIYEQAKDAHQAAVVEMECLRRARQELHALKDANLPQAITLRIVELAEQMEEAGKTIPEKRDAVAYWQGCKDEIDWLMDYLQP